MIVNEHEERDKEKNEKFWIAKRSKNIIVPKCQNWFEIKAHRHTHQYTLTHTHSHISLITHSTSQKLKCECELVCNLFVWRVRNSFDIWER